MYILISYVVYLGISFAATIWVARTLHTNARIFLIDAFHGNTGLADSVNRLLVVGFYLVNVGYVTLALRTTETLESARAAIELVSGKIGVVLVVLGIMHFFDLYAINRLCKRGRERPGTPLAPPARGWGREGAPLGKVLE
jgi:hypothetical protein